MTKPMPIEQIVAEMQERIAAIAAAEKRAGCVPRLNQAKTIACVDAEFLVHDDIPEDLKHGLFAKPGCYPARLRFANGIHQDDSEKDIRGLSIRVANVEGLPLWGEAGYQDFLLNSHPALFVATPEDFLAFIRARQAGNKLGFFLNPLDPHLKSLATVLKSQKKHLSPLDIRYWSTVPFRLGIDTGIAVKYSVIPGSEYTTENAVQPGADQLRAALKAHLKQMPARLHFALQKQTHHQRMPIDDASVIWDETESPFQSVATIIINDQDFDNPQALARCEHSSFNPWQSLPEHEPLGRMNLVRRAVYAHAAAYRHQEQST